LLRTFERASQWTAIGFGCFKLSDLLPPEAHSPVAGSGQWRNFFGEKKVVRRISSRQAIIQTTPEYIKKDAGKYMSLTYILAGFFYFFL
jgi:hypothetical protein